MVLVIVGLAAFTLVSQRRLASAVRRRYRGSRDQHGELAGPAG